MDDPFFKNTRAKRVTKARKTRKTGAVKRLKDKRKVPNRIPDEKVLAAWGYAMVMAGVT